MLWEKDRYVAPVLFFRKCCLREYDLKMANVNILFTEGAISRKQYDYYSNLPKQKREIGIGYLLRDNPDLSKVLKNGFIKAREAFFRLNQIEDQEVLYIDKDSITLIDNYKEITPLKQRYTQVSELLDFRFKNEYNGYYKLTNGVDFLYYKNQVLENFRLKGLTETILPYHKDFMISMILCIAEYAQFNTLKDCIRLVQDMYLKYTNFELEPEYYRELNTRNLYMFRSNFSYTYFSKTYPMDLSLLDISYNAEILRTFYKYFWMSYFYYTKKIKK